jgi:hypothetical protein
MRFTQQAELSLTASSKADEKFHLIFGLVVVIVFILTGQYMEYVHNRLLPDGARMLYRSRHIYILLAGLLNLVLGTYLVPLPRGWRRTLQLIGSILIILAPGLLLAGFSPNRAGGPTRRKLQRSAYSP